MNVLQNLGINMQDYQNNSATGQVLFGTANTTEEQLGELSKALEAQHVTGRDTTDLTTTSGAPLKVESLDKNLKLTTFKESEIVLWKRFPKLPAGNTVEEYNQLTSYGTERGGFITEGELPVEEDSTYVRRSQLVKYLGVTKAVTHPMMLVNTMIGNAVNQEVKNGTLWILRKLDRALTKGNASLIPEEFNGLYAQHQSDEFSTINEYLNDDIVIDLRGDTMKEAYIENGAETIIENHGYASDMFAPPKVLSGFVQNFYGNKFIQPNTSQVSAGVMGQKVNSFESQFGSINLGYDIFMSKDSSKAYNAGATSANAPGAVTSGSLTPVAASVANSKWASTDAGDYCYGVVALNRYGEGAMTILNTSAGSIVTAGAADLAFTAPTGVNAATAYMIYRSEKNPVSYTAATYYPLFAVSSAQLTAGYDGGAAGYVRDMNRWLPDCNQAFMIQNDLEALAFRQLAPLMKMDLAIVSPAFRFMILLYGTPLMFAPRKMVRFINIGV